MFIGVPQPCLVTRGTALFLNSLPGKAPLRIVVDNLTTVLVKRWIIGTTYTGTRTITEVRSWFYCKELAGETVNTEEKERY